jgi:hypothetical protein
VVRHKLSLTVDGELGPHEDSYIAFVFDWGGALMTLPDGEESPGSWPLDQAEEEEIVFAPYCMFSSTWSSSVNKDPHDDSHCHLFVNGVDLDLSMVLDWDEVQFAENQIFDADNPTFFVVTDTTGILVGVPRMQANHDVDHSIFSFKEMGDDQLPVLGHTDPLPPPEPPPATHHGFVLKCTDPAMVFCHHIAVKISQLTNYGRQGIFIYLPAYAEDTITDEWGEAQPPGKKIPQGNPDRNLIIARLPPAFTAWYCMVHIYVYKKRNQDVHITKKRGTCFSFSQCRVGNMLLAHRVNWGVSTFGQEFIRL